jgi:elongation factor Ts
MSFSAQDVKALRERTGAGMMDCKKALTESNGNEEEAAKWLREKGIASAAKKAGRIAAEGAICSYIHQGGKYGVLAEINIETDFAAQSDQFKALCNDVCMHICSAAPRWVRQEEVPQDAIDAELEIFKNLAAQEGKPENIQEKIAQGRLKKWYTEVCLYDQPFVKDPDKSIETLLKEASGTIGEKIEVRRFVRFERGEGIEKKEENLADEVAAAVKASESK